MVEMVCNTLFHVNGSLSILNRVHSIVKIQWCEGCRIDQDIVSQIYCSSEHFL